MIPTLFVTLSSEHYDEPRTRFVPDIADAPQEPSPGDQSPPWSQSVVVFLHRLRLGQRVGQSPLPAVRRNLRSRLLAGSTHQRIIFTASVAAHLLSPFCPRWPALPLSVDICALATLYARNAVLA